MAFSITNSVAKLGIPGGGAGKLTTGNNDTVANTETVAASSISPGQRSGWVRVQTTPSAGTTTTAFKIVATDGSTSYTIAQQPATAAGEYVDMVFPFHLDIAATSFTATFTLGGAGPTLTRADIEVYAAD